VTHPSTPNKKYVNALAQSGQNYDLR
jgi:hypothetical protein